MYKGVESCHSIRKRELMSYEEEFYDNYNNNYDGYDYDDYYEEDEADFNLLEALSFAADKISKYISKKATKIALKQLVAPGSTIVIYNNDTKLELMCKPVDNTKMTYEEFCKNHIQNKVQFEVDIDHIINQNTTAGKVEALLKDIFEL